MKREETISYEKPQLEVYPFAVKVVAVGGPSQGGDIPEGCGDPGFDDD